jgi:hypothetical protein
VLFMCLGEGSLLPPDNTEARMSTCISRILDGRVTGCVDMSTTSGGHPKD